MCSNFTAGKLTRFVNLKKKTKLYNLLKSSRIIIHVALKATDKDEASKDKYSAHASAYNERI
jgi:hypothetical protein